MSISIGRFTFLDQHRPLAPHHSYLLSFIYQHQQDPSQTLNQVKLQHKVIKQTPTLPKILSSTIKLNTKTTTNMSSQSNNYATSTYSETSTISYDKPSTPEEPRKTKRSFRQRVKDVVKDIGTSPFQYDDETEKRSFAWVATLPPSRI